MLNDILSELEALVEIYTNLFVVRDGLPNKLVVHLDAEIKLDQFNTVIIRKDENHSFQIHHFPPITTRFTFSSQEDHIAPQRIVEVSCNWLPSHHQQTLVDKIQSILSNCSIDEGMLWNCFQFIENECLSIVLGSREATGAAGGDLTIDIDELIEKNEEEGEEKRDNEDLFEILKDYDKRKSKRVFDESFIECGVCFTWKRGSDCMELQKCGHVVCLRCVTESVKESMKSGNLELECLVCNEKMEYGEVKLVLKNDEFERWDKLLLNRCLKQATEISECPRCTVSVFTEEQHGFCAQCHFVFCVECRKAYHGSRRCDFIIKRMLEEFNEKEEEKRRTMLEEFNKKEEEKRRATLEEFNKNMEDKLRENVCFCPNCEVGFEKSGGCNKMTCGTCGTFFCHLCSAILSEKNPYKHFGLYPKCFL